MEYKRSEFARMAGVDISSNGFRILRTPRYQKIIMKTVIRDFGNGQGAIEWLVSAAGTNATIWGVLQTLRRLVR